MLYIQKKEIHISVYITPSCLSNPPLTHVFTKYSNTHTTLDQYVNCVIVNYFIN